MPVASGGFGADDIAALAADPRTAFVTPETRAIAAGLARLRNRQARTSISGLAIQPTGQGDPMLGSLPAPEAPDRIVLSRAAAEALQAGPGTALIAEVSRQRGGRFDLARLPVTVTGITDGPVPWMYVTPSEPFTPTFFGRCSEPITVTWSSHAAIVTELSEKGS